MVSSSSPALASPDEAYYREEDHESIRQAYVAHTDASSALAGVADPEGAAHRIMAPETAPGFTSPRLPVQPRPAPAITRRRGPAF